MTAVAGPEQAPLAVPSWFGPVDADAEASATAILLAAAELFGERSPSQVSLRAIAARAGVNYGLIHHYFGTKEAVLTELMARASTAAADRMAEASTIDEALGVLVDPAADAAYARMLAWAMLDGTDPSRLVGASPAIARLTELLVAEAGDRDLPADPSVLAAAMVSAILGWRLFRPFVTTAVGLDGVQAASVPDAVRALVGGWADHR
jgi:TetR/AcrR family transcriptional regulator, repressor for neighboring sulfatase